MTIQQALDIAVSHHNAGRLAEAERIYRQILAQHPDHPESLHFLGAIAHQMGRHRAAVDLIGRAIVLRPGWAEAINNLGEAFRLLGRLEDAIAAYQQAIALKPDYGAAYSNLGGVLCDQGKLDEAIAACSQAIALEPSQTDGIINLANVLCDMGRTDQAIAAYRQAVAIRPESAAAHNGLGVALKHFGQSAQAIAEFRQTLIHQPNLAEAWNNLGNVLGETGQFDDGIAACRQAIALKPDYADAHYNLALLLLLRGDFPEGWAEHEWRWRVKEFPSTRWNYSQPQWDGANSPGGTIFLHFEQGFGDTIQFSRYISLVAERCRRVVVMCQPELHRLLRRFSGVTEILSPGERLPPFDAHCPMLSLPLVFGTTLQSVPAAVMDLQTDARDVVRWRKRLAAESGGSIKIGLAWAGDPRHRRERDRSMTLASLKPLAGVDGVSFFSLQFGEASKQAQSPVAGIKLIDWTADLRDFADTAALIAALDLVITVDTAVAHLTGALGMPVWTLLPFVPDWRWLLDRDDSPWYPTMRLFRQSGAGDWSNVIARVATALRHHVETNRGGARSNDRLLSGPEHFLKH